MRSVADDDAPALRAVEEDGAAVMPELLDLLVPTGSRVDGLLYDDREHALLSIPMGAPHVLMRWVSTHGGPFALSIHLVSSKGFIGLAGYREPVTVLSDADILRARAEGELTLEPFVEAHLTPNGYDVSVEEVAVPSKDLRVREGVARVPPLTRFAVSTRETVTLGRRIAGQIWLRTTWARRGVLASFGMIDAGFSGTLTFGALNASDAVLELPVGERFAQIVFVRLASEASATYEKRSGTYQGQRGVTLERP